MQMKIFFIILFLTLVGGSFSLAQEKDSAASYRLKVISETPGKDVMIDSAIKGVTPLVVDSLKRAIYNVRLIDNENILNWNTEKNEIRLDLKSDTVISFADRYNYFINSDPFGVGVFYSDSLLGVTPLYFSLTEKPTGFLKVRKTGYEEGSVKPEGKSLFVRLKSMKEGIESIVFKNKDTKFKTKRNFFAAATTGALAIISGIATARYKAIANESYDAYLVSGSRDNLDRANRFDVYSGIGLAAMQAAVCGLIYFLFLDK